VEISEDGYVTFKSRIKRIIKVSGFAVFPNQIEQVAVSFDGISRACALGFTDPITMSKVVLFYETLNKKNIDEIKLLVVLKKHLEPKAVPREIRFTEKIPLTPYNKIDVAALRKLYEEIKTM
jgi:long-chain acyl-CoA synthetase